MDSAQSSHQEAISHLYKMPVEPGYDKMARYGTRHRGSASIWFEKYTHNSKQGTSKMAWSCRMNARPSSTTKASLEKTGAKTF